MPAVPLECHGEEEVDGDERVVGGVADGLLGQGRRLPFVVALGAARAIERGVDCSSSEGRKS